LLPQMLVLFKAVGTDVAPGEGFEPSRPFKVTSYQGLSFQACALPG
jgi:hypothetical protein